MICEYSSSINPCSLCEFSRLNHLEVAAKCRIVSLTSLFIQPSAWGCCLTRSLSSVCFAWCYVLNDQPSQCTVHLTCSTYISLFFHSLASFYCLRCCLGQTKGILIILFLLSRSSPFPDLAFCPDRCRRQKSWGRGWQRQRSIHRSAIECLWLKYKVNEWLWLKED